MSEFSEEEPIAQEPPSKVPSPKIMGTALVLSLALIAVIVGALQQNNESSALLAQEKSISAAAALAESAWIPSGYTVFTSNSEIAQDESANPACASSSDTGGKFCWTYKIATKSDCSQVIASLDLTNGSTVVATVTGEVDDVTALTPTVLEIDSGLENDSVVNSTTKGKLTSIECN